MVDAKKRVEPFDKLRAGHRFAMGHPVG